MLLLLLCVSQFPPLLLIGVENDGLLSVVVVSLQLVAEDPLTGIAVKGPTHLLNGICDSHVLGDRRWWWWKRM